MVCTDAKTNQKLGGTEEDGGRQVLSLDDPRWYELRGGYSRPDRYLPALRRLSVDPAAGPSVVGEFNRENYVCHQYSVYQATLAVVPHFVHAAGRLPPPGRSELLSAAGFYALLLGVPFASREVPDPPPDLVADYERAVRAALPLAGEALAAPPSGADSERDMLRLMAAVAGFRGQSRVGVLLEEVTGSVFCQWCEAEFDALAEWGKGF